MKHHVNLIIHNAIDLFANSEELYFLGVAVGRKSPGGAGMVEFADVKKEANRLGLLKSLMDALEERLEA